LRVIYVNNVKPDDYNSQIEQEEPLVYSDNRMITSKVNFSLFKHYSLISMFFFKPL